MTEEQIKKLIADALKASDEKTAAALKTQLADLLKTQLAESLKTTLAEALKPATDGLAALTTKVEAIEKAAPKPDDKKTPAAPEGVAAAVKAALDEFAKGLEPQLKLVGEMHAKTTAQEGAAVNKARVEAWLKTNRPNLPKASIESWVSKLTAANAKDDAGVATAFDAELKLLTPILGADAVKPFMADFKGEGGKPGEGGGADDKKAIEAQAIKHLKDMGTPGRV